MRSIRSVAAFPAALALSVVLATSVLGTVPTPPVFPISSIPAPARTLVQPMPVDVLSISAWTKTINQSDGQPQGALVRQQFPPAYDSGWHMHAGPVVHMIVTGGMWLYNDKCEKTWYGAGQGFVTGLGVHKSITVDTTDFYVFVLLPKDYSGPIIEPAAAAPECAS
jgi:quercetin dioxygenase-like cupin family protein